ncbi:MAG: energy transducer TonB [Owenweeksia sp.]
MKKFILFTLLLSLALTYAQGQEDIIYTRVEAFPVHEGCEETDLINRETCFDKHIQNLVSRNFVFPESARKAGVGGTISVSFIIEKDGNISETRVSKGIQEDYQEDADQLTAAQELEREALNSINGIKISKPATMQGKPVRMKYTFPIEARLKNK